MKKITLLFCFAVLLFACSESDNGVIPQEVANLSSERILEEPTPLNNILLPSGTKVVEISESEIQIELPQEYRFLTTDNSGAPNLSRFGGYSCTCSASNSCKVFFNSKVGYGCLQNSCTGSCTGMPVDDIGIRNPLLGVLNVTKNEIMPDKNNFGNLTDKGLHLFFESIASQKISEIYNFIYLSLIHI